jgi:hypothetical protein
MGAPQGGGASDFAVSEFMSKVDSKGSLARRNRFTVEITPPNSLQVDLLGHLIIDMVVSLV